MFHFPRPPHLILAATLSLGLLAGCQAPVVPPAVAPGAEPAVAPQAPGPTAPALPVAWTLVEGQATFRGEPLADKPVRVVDAFTGAPAITLAEGATQAALTGGGIAVRTGSTLRTDAEGRYSLAIAGLAPGRAARLVVAAGSSGLSTLVPGSAVAAPERYRVATTFIVGTDPLTGSSYFHVSSGRVQATTNEHSTLHSHLFSGPTVLHELASTGASNPPPPPVLVYPTQQIDAGPPQLFDPSVHPTLPNQLIRQTDPDTGGPMPTPDFQQLVQQASPDVIAALIKNKAEIEQQNDEFMQYLQDSQAGGGDVSGLEEKLKAAGPLSPDLASQLQQLAQLEAQRRQQADAQLKQEIQQNTASLIAQIQRQMEALRQQNERARREAEERARTQLLDRLPNMRPFEDQAVRRAMSAAGPQAREGVLTMTAEALRQAANRMQAPEPPRPPIIVPLPAAGLVAVPAPGGTTVSAGNGQTLTIGQEGASPQDLVKELKKATSAQSSSSGGGSSSSPAAVPAAVTSVVAQATDIDGETMITIGLSAAPGAVVADEGCVWVAVPGQKRVLRILNGAETAADITTFALPGEPKALALATSGVVVALCGDNTLARLDGDTGGVASHALSGVSGLKHLAADDGEIVVASDYTVWRLPLFEADATPEAPESLGTVEDAVTSLVPNGYQGWLFVSTTDKVYENKGNGFAALNYSYDVPDRVTAGLSHLVSRGSAFNAIDRASGKLVEMSYDNGLYLYPPDTAIEGVTEIVKYNSDTWVVSNTPDARLYNVSQGTDLALTFAPSKLAVDSAGDVWLADADGKRLVKVKGLAPLTD